MSKSLRSDLLKVNFSRYYPGTVGIKYLEMSFRSLFGPHSCRTKFDEAGDKQETCI